MFAIRKEKSRKIEKRKRGLYIKLIFHMILIIIFIMKKFKYFLFYLIIITYKINK